MGEEASEAMVGLGAARCVAWHCIAYVNSGPQTPVGADEAIGRLFVRRASKMKVAAGKFLGRLGVVSDISVMGIKLLRKAVSRAVAAFRH